MARGRFLSRSISTNEQLAGVSFAADYLFTRCIPHLDVEGRMSGNPTLIKAEVVPLRNEITAKQIPRLLEELADATDHTGQPLIIMYDVGGQKVLQFPGFGRQQPGLRVKREAPSRFPSYAGNEPATARANGGPTPATVPPKSGATPGKLPHNSRATPAQGEVQGEVEVQVQVQAQVQVAEDGEERRSAIALVAAANRGIAERWGEQPEPIMHGAGTTVEAVEALVAAGVDLEFARDAIYTHAITAKIDEPPYSLNFFVRPVIRRWKMRQEHLRANGSQAVALAEEKRPADPRTEPGRATYEAGMAAIRDL